MNAMICACAGLVLLFFYLFVRSGLSRCRKCGKYCTDESECDRNRSGQ